MPQESKQNILIIGNLHSHPSAEAFLRKFLKILCPLSDSISLISGDLPLNFSGKIQWIKTESRVDNKSSMLARLTNYTLNQIYITFVIVKLFRKSVFDVIIFLPPAPVPILLTNVLRKKIIIYRGGSSSEQYKNSRLFYIFSYLFFEKLPAILADKIIVESRNSIKFQDLEKYKDKVVISSLYVDTNRFRYKKEIEKRKERIGYIGILNKNKGVDKFSKAIIIIYDFLKEKNTEVVIGGDGPLFSSIREMIEKSNLSNTVTFTGWLPHEKLSESLNELKLLVLPSYSEGMPNIVLEAMACGTPVLAMPVGAIPDVITDGETGFIMEDNSPTCIAENVVRALEHPDLEMIVGNARALVEREFTYEAAVERYRKILENI
jgi:glycosyltransferase involved in cell wall biosynthesis